MADLYLSPVGNQGNPFVDDNGDVLAGGKVNTYTAGTTTPEATYTTLAGDTAQANPIVLDADGRPPDEIWLTVGTSYKFVVTDSADVTQQTLDEIFGIGPLATAVVNEWQVGPAPTFTADDDPTTFTMLGDQTSTFTVGRRLKLTDSSTLYATILAAAYNSPTNKTTVYIEKDSGALTSSLSAVEYGILASTNTSIPQTVQAFPTSFITGFVPSHDTDTANDMAITAGMCRNAGDTKNVISTITYAKQLDAAWATGDDAGGLFSGATAYADGVSYHGCLIENDTTGALEWGFDSDPAGANTPAGYSFMRRLFSIIATAGPAIVNDSWREKAGGALEALLDVPVFEFTKTWSGGVDDAAQTGTLSQTPGGVQMEAILSVTLTDATASAPSALRVSPLDITDTAPTAAIGTYSGTLRIGAVTGAGGSAVMTTVRTSISGTFRYRSAGSTTSHNAAFSADGFIDERR